MKALRWKFTMIVTIILVAFICILPNINPNLWPHNKINLGLDLQGGMHVVLSVDTDKAIGSALKQVGDDICMFMRKKQISVLNAISHDPKKLRLLVSGSTSEIEKFTSSLKDSFSDLESVVYNIKDAGSSEFFFQFSSHREEEIKKLTIEQALETIRNRIDQFGVSEPDIRLKGSQHILIQLPGIKNSNRAKELIGRTAVLEFKIVNKILKGIENLSREFISPETTIVHKRKIDEIVDHKFKETVLVNKQAIITGAHIIDAKVCIDSHDNIPYVMIKFSKIGAKIFKQVTSENINKRLAIILDGSIHSTPVIAETISGGQARITGNFSMEDAKDLAIVLRAGVLPAPVEIVEERTVGPLLGIDSIKTGLTSIFVASVIVTIFMLLYYKWAGIVANFALILNVLIISAGLAIFDATLTLPGIAGIILTIGMAVDSNVLIFERIREEIRLGRSPISSVASGYSRATLTILDANITNLIAALVLFQFGTGPIKGFAVTLTLGVIASLFTSLIFTRTIFEYFLMHRKIKNIII